MPNAATIELIDALDTAGPFGSGAPHPKYVFPNQSILFSKRVGIDHLKLTFGSNNKSKIEAICFRAFNSPLGEALENHSGKKFHLAGVLGKNTWQGRQTVQLTIEDAAHV
jgi:single-stranded-DNA-specific exonuclease